MKKTIYTDNHVSDQLIEEVKEALKEYDLKLDGIKTKATEIRDKIMEWLGFHKEINEETGEIKWVYDGFGKTLSNIYNSLKKTNGIVKILVGYGLYKLLTKITLLL